MCQNVLPGGRDISGIARSFQILQKRQGLIGSRAPSLERPANDTQDSSRVIRVQYASPYEPCEKPAALSPIGRHAVALIRRGSLNNL